MAHLQNIRIENCGGSGISVKDGAVYGNNVVVSNCGNDGISATDGSTVALSNSISTKNRNAGFSANDSDFLLDNFESTNNDIGIDLGRGSRGDILNSKITGNRNTDIRYSYNVLVGVFDTAARDIINRTDGQGLNQVDAEWIANDILWTTDLGLKAEKMVKLSRKVAAEGIKSPIIGESYSLAKSLLGL